jgi:DNA-damage-inducible protein J
VDEQTKRDVVEIVEDFGLDLSSVTRAFYRQIVRERRIPLTLSYPEPNEESLESIRDAEAILASGGHGYRTAREMLEAALEA